MSAPAAPTTAPPGLAIRPARVADAEALAALQTLPGFVAGTLGLPFEGGRHCQTYLEGLGDTRVLLVAELGGDLVGSAGWSRFTGRRHHVAGLGMGVHDAHAGRGIGTALLGRLIDGADRWYGIGRLELGVFVDNAPAIRLYRGFGFVEEGVSRADAFRDGRFCDVLRMARLAPAM